MNPEVHIRFWERPEVKILRAIRQERRFGPHPLTVRSTLLADILLCCREPRFRVE
jgi:hypothetical protein